MSEHERERLPVRVIVASTVIALLAALATYVVLEGGDDGEQAGADDTVVLDLDGNVTVEKDSVTFQTYEGEEVALASLRGGPVLVNFFASTCAPCIEEMPALEEIHQELGDQVTFLGLAVQDRPEDALDLVERTGVSYRTALDKRGDVIYALGGILLPTTVVLDADGEIVGSHTGELTADEIRTLLTESLGLGA